MPRHREEAGRAGAGGSSSSSSSRAPVDPVRDEEEEAALWDVNLRRKIRSDQRRRINEVHRNRDDITLPDQLIRHVNALDRLMKDVVATREAAIDAEGFRLLSSIGREQVEATHGDLIQFDAINYAEQLVTFMGGRRGGAGHLNWTKLGDRALKMFHTAPSTNFLFGALDLEPLKQRKKQSAPRRKVDMEAAASKPKEVKDITDEEESTTKDVQHILNIIYRRCQEKGRVGYFQFLVDPASFARTVENMFHFAFLIKDGRVGVTLGKDGIPYIYRPSNTVSGISTKTEKQQVIVSLTIEDWKRAIAKFNITETSIPPRGE